MTKKIAQKDIVPATTGGKALRLDEEDVDNEDLDTTISSKAKSTKEQPKIKNTLKSGNNEESKGGNVFDGVVDS
jgi:hypothetical protein